MTHFVLDARAASNHFPGIGRYVFNLAQALAPLLRETEQLTLLYDPTQPSRWDLSTLGRETVRCKQVEISPFSLKQQVVIPRILQEVGADVYHSPYYVMPYRPKLPTLVTFYDVIPLRYPQYVSWRARWLFSLATRLALRTATYLTTISQATHADLMAYFPGQAHRASPIPLAADPTFTPQSEAKIAEVRERLGLPEKYVLYLGSNKPHKNLSRLIEAWSGVNNRPCPLIIAGAWYPDHPEAKTRLATLGLDDVHFLGLVAEADLPALYSGATLFVFPSEYEGFGLPVLEAMACGTPVICSNTSSLPEVAGGAAVMVDPLNTSAMSQTLETLLHDSESRAVMRQRGLVQAKRFSWQFTAQETLRLYRRLAKERN